MQTDRNNQPQKRNQLLLIKSAVHWLYVNLLEVEAFSLKFKTACSQIVKPNSARDAKCTKTCKLHLKPFSVDILNPVISHERRKDHIVITILCRFVISVLVIVGSYQKGLWRRWDSSGNMKLHLIFTFSVDIFLKFSP
jgi:hypothetical protein